VLLNGWKEIAIYLRSGIRTVQRWEALGLPTMRLRSGNRGPVVARTENLDAWLSARSLKNKGRTRPDLQATFSRVAAVRARAMEEMRVLLQNEWRIAVTMAEQALRTRDVKKAERLTAMARQAYDSILRLSLRMNLSGEAETLQFKKDLDSLKGTLRKLGDDF
jgi:hypothetical protein